MPNNSELHRTLERHFNGAGLYFFSVLVSWLYVLSDNNNAKEEENKEKTSDFLRKHVVVFVFSGIAHCRQYICQVCI